MTYAYPIPLLRYEALMGLFSIVVLNHFWSAPQSSVKSSGTFLSCNGTSCSSLTPDCSNSENTGNFIHPVRRQYIHSCVSSHFRAIYRLSLLLAK